MNTARNGSKTKVAFLLRHGRELGCSRIRVYGYFPYLEEMGFTCRALTYPRVMTLKAKADFAREAIWLARWADLIVMQRLVLKVAQFELLRRLNPAIVFDLDDAIYATPDSSAGDRQTERMHAIMAARLAKILGRSRGIVAGSRYLADYASRFNDRVAVIPSPIDTGVYQPRTSPENAGTRCIGWIGSPENLHDFRAIGDPGKFLEALRGKALLKIVGARPPLPESPNIVFEEWSLNREMEHLHSFDIGIMPLNDTERSRGRCSYKAIQYMGVGIPVIASPVGAASDYIEDRSTGILASSNGEWIEAATSLIEDDGLRARMGAAGYARVKERYNYEVNVPLLVGVFKEALRQKGQG
jgi:glycosyltransferase involved in cell wall biosynthesis